MEPCPLLVNGKPCVWEAGHKCDCAPRNGTHTRYGPPIGKPAPKPRLVKKPKPRDE